MRCISITLAVLLALLPLASEAQQQPSCGDPPRVDDQSLKGDLEGKAKFLSSLVGDAGLKGQIETARTDIFSKYPNADRTRSDAYLEYMLCSFVLSDPKLSPQEKFRAIQEFRQAESQPPQSSPISTKGAQSPAVESKGDTSIGYGAAPPASPPGNSPSIGGLRELGEIRHCHRGAVAAPGRRRNGSWFSLLPALSRTVQPRSLPHL